MADAIDLSQSNIREDSVAETWQPTIAVDVSIITEKGKRERGKEEANCSNVVVMSILK